MTVDDSAAFGNYDVDHYVNLYSNLSLTDGSSLKVGPDRGGGATGTLTFGAIGASTLSLAGASEIVTGLLMLGGGSNSHVQADSEVKVVISGGSSLRASDAALSHEGTLSDITVRDENSELVVNAGPGGNGALSLSEGGSTSLTVEKDGYVQADYVSFDGLTAANEQLVDIVLDGTEFDINSGGAFAGQLSPGRVWLGALDQNGKLLTQAGQIDITFRNAGVLQVPAGCQIMKNGAVLTGVGTAIHWGDVKTGGVGADIAPGDYFAADADGNVVPGYTLVQTDENDHVIWSPWAADDGNGNPVYFDCYGNRIYGDHPWDEFGTLTIGDGYGGEGYGGNLDCSPYYNNDPNSEGYGTTTAGGFTLDTVLGNDGQCNKLVVNGTATLYGDIWTPYDGQQFNFFADGMTSVGVWPILVAGDIEGEFTFPDNGCGPKHTYVWGDPLPGDLASNLPVFNENWSWRLFNVQVTDEESPDYGRYELVLSNDPGYDGYGNWFRSQIGNGMSISRTAAPDQWLDQTGPVAPSVVQAFMLGSDKVRVAWLCPPQELTLVKAYVIQRQTDDGDWVTLHTMRPLRDYWIDNTAMAGHTYRYQVQTVAEDDVLSPFTTMTYSVTT